MKEAIDEWYDARTKIVKAILKMNYRISTYGKKPSSPQFKYFFQKKIVLKELGRMDQILMKILKELK